MLMESGIGKSDDIRRATQEAQGLGLFVRSLVGMDRAAAKEALAGFLVGKTLGASQIEFVNLVVDYLTEHGAMSAEALYESPFTDLSPRGPESLFSTHEIDELLSALHFVRQTAIAA
jgi:type I restriction enzyme R subunit